MAAGKNGVRIPVEGIRECIIGKTPQGMTQTRKETSDEEIGLAFRGMPKDKAAEPDLFAAELRKNCPSAHKGITKLFTAMIQQICFRLSEDLRRYYIVPLYEAGMGPVSCANRTTTALLSLIEKLLELVLVWRMMPRVDGRISISQYACQRVRSTEMLLPDLDLYVTREI